MSTPIAFDQAPRVTLRDVNDAIAHEHYFTAAQGVRGADPYGPTVPAESRLRMFTICVLELRNGFIVTGENACVSPDVFSSELGKEKARSKAMDKVWELLGYTLCGRLTAVEAAAQGAAPRDP